MSHVIGPIHLGNLTGVFSRQVTRFPEASITCTYKKIVGNMKRMLVMLI